MAQSRSGTKRRSSSGGSKRSSRSRSSSSSNGSSKLQDKDEMKERDQESQELEESDEGSDDAGGNMSKAEESQTGGKAMGRPPADSRMCSWTSRRCTSGSYCIDVGSSRPISPCGPRWPTC